jgi:hypothetical protein
MPRFISYLVHKQSASKEDLSRQFMSGFVVGAAGGGSVRGWLLHVVVMLNIFPWQPCTCVIRVRLFTSQRRGPFDLG